MALSNLVSIGLPVRNGAGRMERALDSLLSQTHPELEIIISDNASTDRTAEIGRAYARQDSRVRYLRQPENVGQAENYRRLVQAARGTYVLIAQDDDWWEPNFIARLVTALDQNPGYGVAFCSFERVYDDGARQTVHLDGNLDLCAAGHLSVYRRMLRGEPIHLFLHGLFRRAFLSALFRRPAPGCIRWDRVLMAEAALAARFYTLPDLLYHKRAVRVPIVERYAADQLGAAFRRPFAYTSYVCAMLGRMMTSPLVPLSRKLGAVAPWVGLLWRYKDRVGQEVWEWARR